MMTASPDLEGNFLRTLAAAGIETTPHSERSHPTWREMWRPTFRVSLILGPDGRLELEARAVVRRRVRTDELCALLRGVIGLPETEGVNGLGAQGASGQGESGAWALKSSLDAGFTPQALRDAMNRLEIAHALAVERIKEQFGADSFAA